MTRHDRARDLVRCRIATTAVIASILLSGAVLLVGVVPSADALDSAPGAMGDPGTGWMADVLAAGGAGGQQDPSLATGRGGWLYLVYEEDLGGDRDVLFRLSTNGGATWTSPYAIAATAANETDPWIVTDPYSGRIFVTYARADTEIIVAYSDEGFAWSTVTAWTCGGRCERPRVVAEYWNGTDNRQYVVFAGEVAANDWDVFVTRSTDQGATWALVYQSGFGVVDVRYQPTAAVQRGTDGVDRLIFFYRYGGTVATATNGYMEWSQDHGTTWLPRAFWAVNVYTPPSLVAAHNGESVMIVYSTASNNVVWGVDQDPRNLNWGTSTSWDWWVGRGYSPVLGVDGDGSTDPTVGGDYHITFFDIFGPAVLYSTAAVTMTSQAGWSALRRISDAAANAVGSLAGKSVTTQARAGTWYPGVAWVDSRNASALDEVYYVTEGSTWSFDTVPSGLELTVDGVTRTTPFSVGFPVSTSHTVEAPSPQAPVSGVSYGWWSWSDGGGRTHTVNATTSDEAISATFATQYELTIVSSPLGRDVEVDGVRQATPASFWLFPGTYSVTVPSPQLGAPGWRYLFADWSDGGAQTHDVTVSAPASLTVNFTSQVLLDLNSAYGGVTGFGWYDVGAVATIGATSPVSGGAGVRYAFDGWTGDLTSAAPSAIVTMDAPKTVTATWRTEYELVIVTDHGSVTGAGWYASGEVATVSVAATQVLEGGTSWRFTGWSGDATGTAATITVTIDAPKSLTADWQVQTGLVGGGIDGFLFLLLGLVLAAVGFFAFLWLRRRKGPAASAPVMQAVPEPVPEAAPPIPEPPPVPPPQEPPDDFEDWPVIPP
ncbi:MAG: sialidase family protein [Methanobacteriota archaeon]